MKYYFLFVSEVENMAFVVLSKEVESFFVDIVRKLADMSKWVLGAFDLNLRKEAFYNEKVKTQFVLGCRFVFPEGGPQNSYKASQELWEATL